jgi:S1-C subfamily serine protease
MRNFLGIRTLLIALCIALTCPSIIFSEEPDKKLHNRCLYPTVFVKRSAIFGETVRDAGGGSGVIIRSEKVGDEYHNAIITCDHVMSKSTIPGINYRFDIKVPIYKDWSQLVGYSSHPSVVYATNSEKDMAIVLFKSKRQLPTANILFNPKLYIGTKIFKIGHGLGDSARLDLGVITSLEDKDGLIRLSALTVPGDSGGGIYYNYNLIGIARSIRILGGQYVFKMAYMTPMKSLKIWNDEVKDLVGFAFDKQKKMPVIPFARLNFREYKFDSPIKPF